MDAYLMMIVSVLSIGVIFGLFTKFNIDKKNKKTKILSKKQKRDLEEKQQKSKLK